MTVHDVNMMNLGAIIAVTLILATWGVMGLKDRWAARREERQAQLKADRRAAGLCIECGQGVDDGEPHCWGCMQTLLATRG